MTITAGCPPHHWMIEPAAPHVTSRGVCVKCGEVKTFRNSTPEVTMAWKNYKQAAALGIIAIPKP